MVMVKKKQKESAAAGHPSSMMELVSVRNIQVDSPTNFSSTVTVNQCMYHVTFIFFYKCYFHNNFLARRAVRLRR